MKTILNSQPTRRLILVLTAILTLSVIALAPAYLTSLLTTNPAGSNSDASPHVSTNQQGEMRAVETVLVIDPQIEDDNSDEFSATRDPREVTDERIFTIITSDSMVDTLDSSDLITITFDDGRSDGNMCRSLLGSGCRIYMGPYDSQ